MQRIRISLPGCLLIIPESLAVFYCRIMQIRAVCRGRE
jgi:hypothetical protein